MPSEMSALKLSKQMLQILLVLKEERKPIKIAEIIMKVKKIRPATSPSQSGSVNPGAWITISTSKRKKHPPIPRQNRVASGIAHRKVPDALFHPIVEFGHLKTQVPTLNTEMSTEEKKKAEIEEGAIKEADKLYASFCRSMNTLWKLQLVEKRSFPVRISARAYQTRHRSYNYMLSSRGMIALTERSKPAQKLK